MRIRNGSLGRWIGFGLVGGLLLLVVVVLHSVSSMIWAVQGVRSDVDTAAGAISTGDLVTATDAVGALVNSSSELEEVSQSGLWSLAAQAPGVGPSVRALGSMSAVVADMSVSLSGVLGQLSVGSGNAARLVALAEAKPDLENLRDSAMAAEGILARIDPNDLLLGLDDQARDLQAALPRVVSFSNRAVDAAEVLPQLVGMEGSKTWLVMLQNASEARGSGGLLSAYALVQFDGGEVRIVEANTRKAGLDDESYPKVPEIPFERVVESSSVLLWGEYLGEWASFNLSADFPTVAKLAAEGMAARGTPVDGVIAMDAEVVGALLVGTGPVEHKGVVIDGESAPGFFLAGLYEDFPGFANVEAKDQLAMGLMYATVNSVLQRPLNFPGLLSAIEPVLRGGHIKAWSPDPSVEAFFVDIGVAGDLASLSPASIAVAFNNAVGGKLDTYLDTTVTLTRDQCVFVDGKIPGQGESLFRANPDRDPAITWSLAEITVEVTNNAPANLSEYVTVRLDRQQTLEGSTATLVHIYGPVDAEFLTAAIQVNGVDVSPIPFVMGTEAGRPVWGAALDLNRADIGTVALRFAEPRGSEGDLFVPGTSRPITTAIETTTSPKACQR